MARKLRVQFEGAIYHVTIRGVEQRRIFDDRADRERFLLRLGIAVEACGVRLYLFCCMPNHVHLLVETPQANLSVFMHKLQTAYTVYYNRRHQRAGHLLQGRFGARPVQSDTYLLRLSRYIHLNPVMGDTWVACPCATRVNELRQYTWSSYRGYAGLEQSHDFVDEAPVLAMIGSREKSQRLAYRRFVEGGLADTDEEFAEMLKSARWGIGDEAFQERMHDLHAELTRQARRLEDVSFRHQAPQLTPVSVLHAVGEAYGVDPTSLQRRQYACVARAVCAWMLNRHAGMSQRDIGRFLGMGTGAAVCRHLRTLRESRERDSALDDRMTRLDRALAECAGRRAERKLIIKG